MSPLAKVAHPTLPRHRGAHYIGRVRQAKLEDFRFHDLRHTAASYLMMRGASLADVRAALGHADIRMTMRYAYLSPEHLRAAVARLDGLTSTSSEASPPARDQHKVVKSPSLLAYVPGNAGVAQW